MHTTKIKSIALVLSLLSASVLTAQAAVKSPSSNFNSSHAAAKHQLSSLLSGSGSFSDVVNLGVTQFRNLYPSFNGTTQHVQFTNFEFYSSDTNALIKTGTASKGATMALDGVTNAVPEPQLYAMFLSGLGLMAFIARRRSTNLIS